MDSSNSTSAAESRVCVGSRVAIADDFGDRIDVIISTTGAAGNVSPDSPLGRALYGAATGDEITVSAPAGAWTLRVLAIA